MYIHEAIRAAPEDHPWITRSKWTTMTGNGHRAIVRLLPTDTFDCVIMDGYAKRNVHRGWQPTKDDLTATDWVPCDMPILQPGEK